LDGVEIGRVGRQVEHFGAGRLDPLADALDLCELRLSTTIISPGFNSGVRVQRPTGCVEGPRIGAARWQARRACGLNTLEIYTLKKEKTMSIEIVTKSTQSNTITVEAANELIKVARATSQQIGFEVAIAVTDAAGNLKAFERTDACPFLAADVAMDKAWTAAAFGLSTHTWASILTNPLLSQLAHRPRLVAVGGGYPVIENDRVIGAIGISGGTAEQDQQAAEAALSNLGFTLPA
jgi:uncharacterized protein GlcG (DUF336 family)